MQEAVTPATLVCDELNTLTIRVDKYHIDTVTPPIATTIDSIAVTSSYNTANSAPLVGAGTASSVWIGGAAAQTASNVVAIGVGAGSPLGQGSTWVSPNSGQIYANEPTDATFLMASAPAETVTKGSGTTILGTVSASGDNMTIIGCGSSDSPRSDGTGSVAIGHKARSFSGGQNCVAIGSYTMAGNPADDVVSIGALGGGQSSQSVASNCVSIGGACDGTMRGSVSVGCGVVNTAGVSIGNRTNMQSGRCIGHDNTTAANLGRLLILGSGRNVSSPPVSTMMFGSPAAPLYTPTPSNPSQQPLFFTESLVCTINGTPVWIPLSAQLA